MSAGSDPVSLVIGLVSANIAYLIGTLILATLFDATAPQLFSGAFARTASSLVTAWVAIGAMLGATDVLVVLGFISTLTSGW